jgi:uncharacterized membrane protein YeaQ/YmgE (transglycosylase-associated protein family)
MRSGRSSGLRGRTSQYHTGEHRSSHRIGAARALRLATDARDAAAAWRRLQQSPGEHMLWAIIIGLIVGAIAKLVMPGKDPGGIIITILIGIAGSFVGTLIGRTLGFYGSGQGAGIIMSILGAVLLLWIYRMIVARRATP